MNITVSKDQTARLRQTYTGEPYSAAKSWYRANGLFNGLVPDAAHPTQQRLEAAVLRTLARPRPGSLPAPHGPGTLFGLCGVTPDPEQLLLRPADGQLPHILSRLLPARSADGVVGVPGLRARYSRRTGMTLSRIGDDAALTVGPDGAGRLRGTDAQAALEAARALVTEAGLEPLWEAGTLKAGEDAAWKLFAETTTAEEAALWSQALRRTGLFLTARPDWTDRAPTAEEVAGPAPDRLRARPVGPAGADGRIRGVIAVTPALGRGGLGCTTTALAVSAALARGGSRVALLAGASDPNAPFRLQGGRAPAAGEWRDLLQLPHSGLLQIGALAPSDDELAAAAEDDDDADTDPSIDCRPAQEHLLTEAKNAYDVVVIDAGNAFRLAHLTELADITLAVVPYQRHHWFDDEVIDRRPDWVKFLAWLDSQYSQYSAVSRAETPLEQLLTFLDVAFSYYVMWRGSDGEPAVYDLDDPEDAEAWWGDYEHAARVTDEDYVELPREEDAPYLDVWRSDFLAFLDAEGAARHPQTWSEASAQWAPRSRQRNEQGLQPGQSHDGRDVPRTRFLQDIKDEALHRWGETLWNEHHRVWEAAIEAGDDLLSPWGHLVEAVQRPRAAVDIARRLTAELGSVPSSRTCIIVNQCEHNLGYHDLVAVREVLQDEGFESVLPLPRLSGFQRLTHDASQLAKPGGVEAGAANRIALAASTVLRCR
ncbi:hypothetical protein ACH4PU_32640 [Streptomyces sp. NPDC021100]|uniref:hypothetical protein n=1 Tax=Streptomyces sp. NPDC021100 TaxID=3365114 RepID=UPI00379CC6FA